MKLLIMQPSATSSVVGPDVLRALFSNILKMYNVPLVRETRFHTHAEEETRR
jgi:hypothetical protein